MTVRDIILGTQARDWYTADEVLASLRKDDGSYAMEDASFIATFDPEHVALMEAVAHEATRVLSPEPLFSASPRSNYAALRRASEALAAYRAERGLL